MTSRAAGRHRRAAGGAIATSRGRLASYVFSGEVCVATHCRLPPAIFKQQLTSFREDHVQHTRVLGTWLQANRQETPAGPDLDGLARHIDWRYRGA